LHPYTDTRLDSRPFPDEGDERAAVRTLRFLAVAVFVAVLAATLVLSLASLGSESAPGGTVAATAGGDLPATTATPGVVTDLGPLPGVDLAAYVKNRRDALAATKDDRVAVVSLTKYATETQARAIVGSLPVVALLVAPPGVAPSAVTTDLATWAKTQTDATRSEQDEIKKLLPTVDDPSFKAFYNSEVDRLGKAIKNFAPDGPIVFGVVVRGPATGLQAVGARPDVRLVDVGATAQVDPKAVFRGLRPEETTKANDPALRPL
jgi:hypothetical protein